MRPRILPLASSLPRIVRRSYSAQVEPLIKITDLPAPSTGRLRILTLSRPHSRNAISTALLSQLNSAVTSIASEYTPDGSEMPPKRIYGGAAGVDERGPTRAVIIASDVDSVFCAGADLKERRGMSGAETASFLHSLRKTFTTLSTLPIPTISAISSLALGGGLELALSTTFRVLASTAIIGLPETRLGIIPGAGGTFRLPALIGVNRARDLILTGRRVSAAEAYFLGIADRLVEVREGEEEEKGAVMSRAREAVLSEAVRLAGEICEGAPVAVRSALWAVGKGEEVENEMYERVVGTEDRDEALKAFGEKRRPVFRGR